MSSEKCKARVGSDCELKTIQFLEDSLAHVRVHCDALTPNDLIGLGARATSRITPMEEIPLGIPTLVLTAAGTHAIRHGRPCGLSEVATPGPPLPAGRCRLKGPEGGLIGIGEVQLVRTCRRAIHEIRHADPAFQQHAPFIWR